MSQWKTFQIHGRVNFIDEVNEDILNLKVVVNTKVKGEEHASWYRMSAYKHNANFIRQWVNKGDMVLISGTEYQKTYTNKNGQEVTAPQMNVTKIDVMRKSRDSEQSQSQGGGWSNSQQNRQPQGNSQQSWGNQGGNEQSWGSQSNNQQSWQNNGQGKNQQSYQSNGQQNQPQGGQGGPSEDPIPF